MARLSHPNHSRDPGAQASAGNVLAEKRASLVQRHVSIAPKPDEMPAAVNFADRGVGDLRSGPLGVGEGYYGLCLTTSTCLKPPEF